MTRLSRLLERRSDERGFTLIEVAVAVGVFGILLVGMSFIFESAFSTSASVRTDQRAKTLAQEKLEEVRALPYYVSRKTNTGAVDILDRYFPGTTNGTTPTGAEGTYDGSTDVWTYTSTEDIADELGRFERRTAVQFVVVDADGEVTPQPPIPGYDSTNADADQPATSALLTTVTVGWTDHGRDLEVVLDTIITHVRQEEPKVEVTASVTGAQVSGLEFFDGLPGVGVPADVLAQVATASVTFREVTDSTADATADAVEVVERHPDTNSPLQPEGPKDGEAASSVPNSETGTVHSSSDSGMDAGSIVSVNLPTVSIAEWSSVGPDPAAAAAAAQVSARHTLNPEASSAVSASGFGLNGRSEGALDVHRALDVGFAEGHVEHHSTEVSAKVTAHTRLSDVVIWGAPQFTAAPAYRGTVTIDGVAVSIEAEGGTATTEPTLVEWAVAGLRVWDPELVNADNTIGGYVGPWTFGFTSSCGGWVDDPVLCGPNRTDGLEQFENPNPVVIPAAYVGTGPDGNQGLSLAIVAGATIHEAEADASAATSSASVAQKNVLSVTIRNDITDAEALQPMVVGLGDANASISYIAHEH